MELKQDLEDFIRFSDDQNFKMMTSLSQNYIESSIIFSNSARLIESKDKYDDNDRSNHHAYVVGSILFSVLYLESTINEFFINIVEKTNLRSAIIEKYRDELTVFWRAGEKRSIFVKYDNALSILKCQKIEKGKIPCQDIDKFIRLLIKLRNYLVHYKPEWVELKGFENVELTLVDLDKELTELSLACKNPMYDNGFFPNKYLSYVTTHWAITNCIKFVDEFYTNLGMRDIYKDKIEELKKNYGV